MTERKPSIVLICDVCGREFVSPAKTCRYCHRSKCKSIGMNRRKWEIRHDGAPFPLSARRNPADAQKVE